MEKFTYGPIDLGGPATRLLRLHQGNGSEISCELFQARLHQGDDGVAYEALSYTWGSIEISESILVNGKRLGITLNLYLALQQLRRRDEDRILWIDAICIDQSNTKERGHQVRQMGDIFKQADRVVFWLGPGTYESNVFMESMQLLQRESIKHACKFWKRQDERWRGLWAKLQPALRDAHADLVNLQRQGLQMLLDRPWFRRVWILQEVTNAKAAVVCCGTKSVSARLFGLAPVILDVSPDAHCQAVLDIMPGPWREASWWSQSQDLYTLLLNFGGSEATESRDLIYALRGMSSDARDDGSLRPDYEKSEEKLIRDVMRFIYYCEIEDLGSQNVPATIRQLAVNLGALNSTTCMALARTSKKSNMEMLLRRAEVKVDHDMVKTVVTNDETGEMTELLLRLRESEFEINHDVVQAAVSNPRGAKAVVDVLLRLRGGQVTITEKVLMAAAVNNKHGEVVMELLLQLKTEFFNVSKVAETAASNAEAGEKVLEVLFKHRGQEIIITEELLTNAAKNEASGKSVLEFLFEHRGDQIRLTELTIEAAITNSGCGVEILKLLIRRRPHDLQITRRLILASTQSSSSQGREAMELLLENQVAQNPKVTEEEFITFVSSSNTAILKVFLQHRSSGLTITRNVVQAAATNHRSGDSIAKIILRDCEHSVKVEDDAAIELIKNFDIPMAEAIIHYRKDQFINTEPVVQAILDRFMSREERRIWSPLSFACWRGYVGIVNLLIARGENIEKGDIYGRTPLILATYRGNLEIMRLLLENGADVEAMDLNGESAMALANGNGYEAAMKLLQEHLKYNVIKGRKQSGPLDWMIQGILRLFKSNV